MGDWEIWVQELDLIDEEAGRREHGNLKGAVRGAIWPEGPHLYKKDGYYYLLHAEGGTGPEHSTLSVREAESCFSGCRAIRSLPSELAIILWSMLVMGDLVEDQNGNWYVVMLATRRCKNHGRRETLQAKLYGRERDGR